MASGSSPGNRTEITAGTGWDRNHVDGSRRLKSSVRRSCALDDGDADHPVCELYPGRPVLTPSTLDLLLVVAVAGVQGYLFMPIILLSYSWGDHLARRWGDGAP